MTASDNTIEASDPATEDQTASDMEVPAQPSQEEVVLSCACAAMAVTPPTSLTIAALTFVPITALACSTIMFEEIAPTWFLRSSTCRRSCG